MCGVGCGVGVGCGCAGCGSVGGGCAGGGSAVAKPTSGRGRRERAGRTAIASRPASRSGTRGSARAVRPRVRRSAVATRPASSRLSPLPRRRAPPNVPGRPGSLRSCTGSVRTDTHRWDLVTWESHPPLPGCHDGCAPNGEADVARGNGSVVRRRQLARLLRAMREESGLTLEQAAPRLDWSTSKLNRIEMAQQNVDVHGVKSMLDLYDVGGDRWTQVIELARAVRQRGWWRVYGSDDRGYVPLEAEASLVRDYTLGYAPGLLQTADYAREIFRSSLYPAHRGRAGERGHHPDDPPGAAGLAGQPAGAGRDRGRVGAAPPGRRACGDARPARPPGRGGRAGHGDLPGAAHRRGRASGDVRGRSRC